MSDSTFILTLAKVIIAAAWADGEIAHEEINALKDLLFRLPDMTGREWAMLEMYMEAPVGDAERERLLAQLQQAMRSREDRQLALRSLDALAAADGVITDGERRVVEALKAEIASTSVGALSRLGHVVKGALERREQALREAPNREAHFEDYIKNKVYYSVQRRLEAGDQALDVPDEELRKLCLAGGLMARVAHVDRQVTDDESRAIADALQEHWGLGKVEAEFIAQVALSEIGPSMDYYRLTREFFTNTSLEERERFLRALFAVAASDGLASSDEIEEIRAIANSLHMTHKQFIDAKLTLPKDKRAD